MIEAVLIGAGQRGHHVYGQWALANPDRLRFVAVADPDPGRVERFARTHGVPASACFTDPLEMLSTTALAPACLIASPDRDHHRQALTALDSGYHVLSEKPMAATLEDCFDLVQAAKGARGSFHVAHVLRYTPFFQTLHEVIASGRIGDVVTVEHRENVRAWHMAHSYVRGNWSRSRRATPMIVAKCCHDFDILTWNLPSEVVRLTSIGSLFEFRPERAPAGATERCVDPCPVTDCPYDGRRVYLDPNLTNWPIHVLTDDLSLGGRLQALQTGPYGVCAYRAGSDVVDHQVVTMEHANGASTVLHMHGHSHEEGRTMRYDGTRATLRGRFGRVQEIEVIDHATARNEQIPLHLAAGGHGGGDAGILESFLASVETGTPPLTSASESLESHLLAFLAEEARLHGTSVEVASHRR
ncbi:MAG TPA: Gfo/Idh/MocA family oxidoreductase [Acidimicrobiia bacterium]|nr:Gfo/Idh/MocA family oxidoreductase [Acidimicrobiia bacterium]